MQGDQLNEDKDMTRLSMSQSITLTQIQFFRIYFIRQLQSFFWQCLMRSSIEFRAKMKISLAGKYLNPLRLSLSFKQSHTIPFTTSIPLFLGIIIKFPWDNFSRF